MDCTCVVSPQRYARARPASEQHWIEPRHVLGEAPALLVLEVALVIGRLCSLQQAAAGARPGGPRSWGVRMLELSAPSTRRENA